MALILPDPSNNWSDIGTPNPGDIVDGQGQTWTAALTIPSSGAAGNPVTYRNFTINAAQGIQATARDYIRIENVQVTTTAAASAGINCGGGCSWWTLDNYRAVDCDSHDVFSAGPDSANYTEGWSVRGGYGVDCGRWGDTGDSDLLLTTYNRRFTVQDRLQYAPTANKGVSGATPNAYAAGGGSVGSGHIWQRCKFSGMEEQGWGGKGCTQSPAGEGPTIVADCGFYIPNTGSGTANWAFGANGGKWLRNYFSGGYGLAIGNTLANASTGNLDIEGCVLADTPGYGVNDFSGGAGGIAVRQCTLTEIGASWSSSESVTCQNLNWTWQNNIIARLSLGNSNSRPMRYIKAVDYDSATMDGNGYWTYDAVGVLVFDVERVRFLNLNALQADGKEANGAHVEPEFISVSRKDYRLQGHSPHIGAGVKWWTGNPPQGQDGLRFPLRNGRPERGAYAVRPGRDGACRSVRGLPLGVLEAGVDYVKARAA